MMFYPRASQPTHAKWEQLYPPTINVTNITTTAVKNDDGNSQISSSLNQAHPPIPPLLLATHLITDTVFESPPFSGLGPPGSDSDAMGIGTTSLPHMADLIDGDSTAYFSIYTNTNHNINLHANPQNTREHDAAATDPTLPNSQPVTTTAAKNTVSNDYEMRDANGITNSISTNNGDDESPADNENDDINAFIPPSCRDALVASLAAQDDWRRRWRTETTDGARGKLKMGFVGVPV